jgi:hypothetical protein
MDLTTKLRSPGAFNRTQGELYSPFLITSEPLAVVPIIDPFTSCAMLLTQQESGMAADHAVHRVGLRAAIQ